MARHFFFLFSLLFIFVRVDLWAQQNLLEIKKADLLRGADGFERLLGSVEMKHQSSLIYCDSAHFFRAENKAKLFGNVRIIDTDDPIVTTSRYAEYDGNTKIAKLRNQVVFTNQETTLYTEFLDYNRATNIANYFNDGRVVDSTNVLTSEKGLYEVSLERITFINDVILVNPDYTMKTNYLVYLTIPKTAETKGLTNLVSKEGNTLDAHKGSFYETQQKQFRFYEGIVDTETSRVKAEELFYDEVKMYYEGKGNVQVLNKEREVEIYGDKGEYYEERKFSKVYGNALVRKYFEQDTLFMVSDSLISIDNEVDSLNYLTAFRNVRLVKSDVSSRSDSLSYNFSDSTIQLFTDPVLWNEKSQITSDSMIFYLKEENLDRVIMKEKAFAIAQDTLLNFNQMKGRKMTGYFSEGNISRLQIDGNAESLYYLLEADSLTQGVNVTLSATIRMDFEDGAIRKMMYNIKPDGRFIPVQSVNDENSRLDDFVWRVEEKPTRADIDDWRKPEEIDLNAENLFDVPEVKIRMPTDDEIQNSLREKGYFPDKILRPKNLRPLKQKGNE
ncbi:OstA-like protein [Algoriphagus namhaensis]|uniref:OstA-like protein n=1 Tax=Algoriphagus namhaensis TaxID=915353 RepID=A0ABV8AMP4_9BACT